MISELLSLVLSLGMLVAAGLLLPLLVAAAEPDVLIATSGEKLIGQFESATAATVTFKSEVAGEVVVAWSKVKEPHSKRRFAVIPKDVKISNAEEAKTIPEGTVSVLRNESRSLPAQGQLRARFPSPIRDTLSTRRASNRHSRALASLEVGVGRSARARL